MENNASNNKKIPVPKKNPLTKGPIMGNPPTPRVPKTNDFKNYDKALEMLDNNVEKAINVFVKGLKDEDKWYRFNCASVILKKVVPDRKIKQIVGDKDRPVEFKITDRREAILAIVNMLDDVDMDFLKEKVDNGSSRILETFSGGEEPEKESVGTEKDGRSLWSDS